MTPQVQKALGYLTWGGLKNSNDESVDPINKVSDKLVTRQGSCRGADVSV